MQKLSLDFENLSKSLTISTKINLNRYEFQLTTYREYILKKKTNIRKN